MGGQGHRLGCLGQTPPLHNLRHLLWAQSLVGSNVCVVVGFSGGNRYQMLRTGPGSPKLLNKHQPLLIENPRHSLFLLGSSLYHFPHILFLSVISLRVISPLGSCNSEASTPLGGRAAVPVTPPPLGRGVGSIF